VWSVGRIKEYLPAVLQPIREFDALDKAQSPELERLLEQIIGMTDEISAASAGEEGLRRYETMLRIAPAPGEAIEKRRFNVMMRLQGHLGYTHVWLEQMLAVLLDENACTIDMDYAARTLTIEVDYIYADRLGAITRFIRDRMPANLLLITADTATQQTGVGAGVYVQVLDEVGIAVN